MRRRPRLVATLLLALAFVVGGLTGMVLEEGLDIDWFEFLDEDSDEAGDSLLAGMDLSPEQRAQAEEILERVEERLENYWESRLPEIRGILRESYAEIRAVLTPEQREVFDARVRELGDGVPDEIRD